MEARIAFYITVEIPAANVTNKTEISVGDGGIREEYINAKLEEGKQYKLFVRAVTRIDGASYISNYNKINCGNVVKLKKDKLLLGQAISHKENT